MHRLIAKQLLLVMATVSFVSCDERDGAPGGGASSGAGTASIPKIAPTVTPIRYSVAVPETYSQLGLISGLEERILEIEIEIAEHNQDYIKGGFDNFLELDPWELDSSQVFFLRHFCENGDFFLMKEAEILLLEGTLERRREAAHYLEIQSGVGEVRRSIHERLDHVIDYYEQRVVNLEKILYLYQATDNPVTYSTSATPEELETAREQVSEYQDEIIKLRAGLDARILELRDELSDLGL